MSHDHSQNSHQQGAARIINWVLCGFILVAAFFLFTEHRAHLYGLLPYALLLACPLMHLFMHHGHGHHGHTRHGRTQGGNQGSRPSNQRENLP